jgi:hypothetical protein
MMFDAVIVRQGREARANVFATYDRPGMLGIRAENSPSTLYLPLDQLDYLIDEARRAQPPTRPEGTGS